MMNKIYKIIKDLFKVFVNLFILGSILFYLYIRFIIEKLPQKLPITEYPKVSIFLFAWLVILNIFLLIIFPLILKSKVLNKKNDSRALERHFVYEYILFKSYPFIWLNDCLLMFDSNLEDSIVDLGIYLFNIRKKYKIISFFVLVFPRLLLGVVFLIELIYFNSIYYFYYVIWLLWIPFSFNLFLFELQVKLNGMSYFIRNQVILTEVEGSLNDIVNKLNPESIIKKDEMAWGKTILSEEEIIKMKKKEDVIALKNAKMKITLTIYAKALRETKLKYLISSRQGIFLIAWVLALIICILNNTEPPLEVLYKLIQELQK